MVLLLVTWGATRLVLLLFVLKVFVFPGADVTSDVSVIYQGWYEVLRHGTFPLDDVTWQYPPAAALAILSPGLLPFLDYPTAFFVLACLADLVVLSLMLYTGPRPGRTLRGAWVWVLGVPLLGPTVYSRAFALAVLLDLAFLAVGLHTGHAVAKATESPRSTSTSRPIWPARGCHCARARWHRSRY
ncbi:hypothetical protein ACWCQR_11110, partial [Streptomyces sp. NPDC002172]